MRTTRGLRYSSHTARSGPGLARVVRLFVWPRHANGVLSTTPLDPCACEMSAQGGNKRRTGRPRQPLPGASRRQAGPAAGRPDEGVHGGAIEGEALALQGGVAQALVGGRVAHLLVRRVFVARGVTCPDVHVGPAAACAR